MKNVTNACMNTLDDLYFFFEIYDSIINNGIQEIKTRKVKLPVNGNEIKRSIPESILNKYRFDFDNSCIW